MQVTVFFSKIRHEIIGHIQKAEREIKLAVAWLTDEDIIRELTHRRKAGVTVKIAISDSIENFINTHPFREFLAAEGELYIATQSFLHHKFCIIDEQVVINGSYNWSYSARTNEENITVFVRNSDTREDNLVFDNFKAKHTYLCDRCSTQVPDLPTLNKLKQEGRNVALLLSVTDEKEIRLREQFQDRIKESFARSRALKISVGESLLERMEKDGGGVEFVKRILHDEMTSGVMKPGFKQLANHFPPKVDLSLEYLVVQPEFTCLFTTEEIEFCKKIMSKYNLL
ncbi:phospholipase D-like domain-containing protein [Pseudoflavitalea rhizosphaerae]|uniref:phospholipase D-like domain-containing protein n=1 Tax=Pseudoflavitalea rhizosphaerae TaxID=1884793 RepID=UPI000F8EBE1E|nr:phospholipase D-like domain-containing protein [Pseudoflavitalea rhizosphaerae]